MTDTAERGTPADGPQVLVAGAGPVGLTVAHELLRRGVRVRLVDRAAGPAVTSRALATHARTWEILHQMGVAGHLLHRGQRVEHFSLHQNGRRLIRFDTNYAAMPTHFPYSVMIDQVVTEEVLRERVAAHGGTIEWGVELTAVTPAADHVTVRLRHADGREEATDVPWLVGADGGRSTVRRQLGLRLLGDSTETWLNADCVIAPDLPRDSNHLVRSSSGALLMVPFPEPGKWRIVDTEETHDADDPEAVRVRLQRKLSRALRREVTLSAPSWVNAFTVQQRMIQQMRVGRCFVAGDAAHVHSPASGQGMNTGIQDGYNLAWKLADVVRGHAEDSLLDSYAAERVPVGRRLLRSTGTATALVTLRNLAAPVVLPVGLGLLRRLPFVKRRIEHKIVGGFCGLTLHYADGPLSRPDPDADPDGVQPGYRVACAEPTARAHPGWAALREELTDPRWTLLAVAPSVARGEDVTPALKHVERHHAGAVSVRTVTDGAAADDVPHPLADPDGGLCRDLGLRPGDLALIRPDGYLAAKGPVRGVDAMTALLADCRLR
jgi:NADPH-dependent dioxygenase